MRSQQEKNIRDLYVVIQDNPRRRRPHANLAEKEDAPVRELSEVPFAQTRKKLASSTVLLSSFHPIHFQLSLQILEEFTFLLATNLSALYATP